MCSLASQQLERADHALKLKVVRIICIVLAGGFFRRLLCKHLLHDFCDVGFHFGIFRRVRGFFHRRFRARLLKPSLRTACRQAQPECTKL